VADAGEPRATNFDEPAGARATRHEEAPAHSDAAAPRPSSVPPAAQEPGAAAAPDRDAAGPATAKPARAVGLADRLLTLAAGFAAAIPVIAATVRAIEAGWVPVADRGIIATRAHDVFTSHMPLVGQYTLAGEVTGHVTHSLGPMLFWLLAVPAYYGSTVGMTVVMGATNTLSIVGCVVLARRRGGRVLMAMSAAAIALTCQSLAAETFHDVWNPSAGLWPFTLLIFLCWAVACGSYRLLPLTAVVASFAVQAHLTYLPPTLALLAVALGGLAWGWAAQRLRRRRAIGALDAAPARGLLRVHRHNATPTTDTTPAQSLPHPHRHNATPTADTTPAQSLPHPHRHNATPTTDATPTRRRLLLRLRGRSATRADDATRESRRRRLRGLAWVLATLLALAACWSATVVGQLTEHPGNLTLVAQSASKHKTTEGEEVGWHAVVRAVGVTPWWLQTPKSRWQRKYEVREQPSETSTRSAIALLAALVVVLLGGLLLRRRAVAAMAACALVLCPALAAVAAATPTPRLLSATLGYTMWWGSQVGMMVWLALAWAAWLCVAWAVGRVGPALQRIAASYSRAHTHAGTNGTPNTTSSSLPTGTTTPSPAPTGTPTTTTPSPLPTADPRPTRARAGTNGTPKTTTLSPRPTNADPPLPTNANTHSPHPTAVEPPRTRARATLQLLSTVLAVIVVAAIGKAVAAQGQPDEHAVTYAPIRELDARLGPLVPRGGSVLLEGTLDGATMPVKPAVRYFLVARGTRVLAPGSDMRLGAWYELYRRPYREAIYLSDVPRPPVRRVPLAFAVSFREGRTRNTVYVWISHRAGR
jgi:hypothetical protein